jgi:hypothetical protein
VGDVECPPGEQLLLGVAEHIAERLVDLAVVVIEADESHADGSVLEGAAEATCALLQLLLYPLAPGNVLLDALPVKRPASRVPDENRALVHPNQATVVGDHAVLHVEGFASLVSTLVFCHHLLQVFGVDQLVPKPRVIHELLSLIAQNAFYLRTYVHHRISCVLFAAWLYYEGDYRHVLYQRAIAGLSL